MYSMTGFGHGEGERDGHVAAVQISSYNRKQLDVRVSLPKNLAFLEKDLRDLVGGAVSRGSVYASIELTTANSVVPEVRVDHQLARRLHQEAELLRQELQLGESLSVHDLLALPGVLEIRPPELDEAAMVSLITGTVKAALDDLVSMRSAEGAKLQADLLGRRQALLAMVGRIAGLAAQSVVRYQQRLRERLQLLAADLEVDEERLAREVVLFADRADVTEELIRLQAHLERFAELSTGGEPSGRKLDFLIQEMGREINTVGAKSADAEIAALVVDVKTELERLREQVQNIE